MTIPDSPPTVPVKLDRATISLLVHALEELLELVLTQVHLHARIRLSKGYAIAAARDLLELHLRRLPGPPPEAAHDNTRSAR